MDRLQKVVAAAGVTSRRNAEVLITAGRVTVNGEIITQLGTQVDPARDVVAVDGVTITRPIKRTIMLNKPSGFVTTRQDPHARDTVMSLTPPIPGLHPVGRLDKDTTGLLLLTNDGDLTYALTHPKHHVDKTYHAWVAGHPGEQALEPLRRGIRLEDGLTAPARVRILRQQGEQTLMEITIHEGRKRQVRRMCAAIGYPVRRLARVRIGPISLGTLREGDWRDLTRDELHSLYTAAHVTLP